MAKPLLPPGVEQPQIGTFLKTILRSALLDQADLEDVLRNAPAACRVEAGALAEHLVKTGKLSRFQAHKLLRGAAGGLVLGPYQVLAPIGKGGQGKVYLARDQRSGELLALKVLPPKKARAEERLLARFRREMELSQRVGHPHIAWTQEVGVWYGVYYIAMEFIPGKSLYRLVGDDGPLTVPRAARLFAEVASALNHAHAQGLIHRDLKPSNILITPNDHAKVLDLGLALIEGEDVSDREVVGGQGYVVGSMDYIAPEQTGDPTKVGPRADVYALGCTLYFALTGQPPFPGGDSKQKMRRHRTEEPVPLLQLNPQVPAGFAALVHRLMAKRPEERVASAGEAQAELERWTAAEPELPLDRESDSAFQQATADLQEEEDWDDAVADEGPEVAAAPPRPRRHPAVLPMQPPVPAPPAAEAHGRAALLPLALGIVLGCALGLAGLVYLLVR
jgi:serine/threonine protein kinase